MPSKHSRLWDSKEIEEILASDMGTEETKCIQFYGGRLNPGIVMEGLRKMKELRFLSLYLEDSYAREINGPMPNFLNALGFLCCNWKFNEVSSYFPDTLRYLNWYGYPFRSLPKTFQGNNLVSLGMSNSDIVQLWEGGERKVLNKLRFLDLSGEKLRTLDLGLTPNLETLKIVGCDQLIKLYMPVECLKLRYLDLSHVKLRTLDLGLIPNLEMLWLTDCDLVELLHMPGRCLNLRLLLLIDVNLRSLDIGLTPNLEDLDLRNCNDLEELHMADGCVKLRSLYLNKLKLRKLDLGPSPYLERLDFHYWNNLEEFHIAECPLLTDVIIRGSKLITLDLRMVPNIKLLRLEGIYLLELHLPSKCINLSYLLCIDSYVETLDIGVTPNLVELDLENSYFLEELHLLGQCHKLAYLNINYTKLRTLDLGLTPSLKELYLKKCYYLMELHAPIGCLKNIVILELSYCLEFYSFSFCVKDNTYGRVNDQLLEVRHPLAELHFRLKSCPLHPDDYFPGFKFTCFHKEDLPSLRRSLEKLISVGPCVCTKFETFSKSICRLQR
ncbi:disease resistance protein RPV1 isoform X1 [Lactuca sativa]|uniref:disease resistance protein RPV1 isoform X1 n=1 Tax=Lactuca sativa TaxID=4236 RepID=UPI000CD7FFBD|nr:disease resistance protein RPV1 isoform X1 [Lactuca sativa]XP_023741490.1 disease resistance protein RPV1 isoform X1 [Lactuca sativa]XP_023741492.1 disease resistance protein RPV1 isoform X1 [Lactuca sativa]XP_052619594.1 disease resistance protein RPV1 isoform X1 [Lactuca sativa]XP_052619595.1 disease resistance protein RPV1 isoform X1 [Lactuca sativa]XP_052619596.1 disease resistance protein RPV1 isoform X1 [Lactuca sativa]XP_052619597.1 disease resistance protein RPV1 isoform X1 [Lactuc